MGKSTPSAPAPPDPAKTSAAQTQSNKETALYNFGLNNPNVISPLGSQTFTQTGGGPQYDNAAYQSALNAWNAAGAAPPASSAPGPSHRPGDPRFDNYAPGAGTSQTPRGAMPTLDQFKTGDLPPTVTQKISLSPAEQQIFDQQTQQDIATNNIAQGYLGRIQNTLGKNLNTSGLPSLQSGVQPGQLQGGIQQPGQLQYGVNTNGLPGINSQVGRAPMQGNLNFSNAPHLQSGVSSAPLQMSAGDTPNLNTSVGNAGDIQRGVQNNQQSTGFGQTAPLQYGMGQTPDVQSGLDFGGAPGLQSNVDNPGQLMGFGGNGPIQQNLNYGGLPGLPGVGDFSAEAQNVANAQYGKQTAYLDPQYQKSQNQLEAQLANQGIYLGSEAYKNAEDEIGRQKSFAYGQARDSAILAGGNEQSRLFGLGLTARQQAQNETNTQGQFANAAQQQDYSQAQGRGQFANQALAQDFSQGLQSGTFQNTARGQATQETAAQGQFANQAAGQQYNQQLGAAQFANQAAGQDYSQAQGRGQFANAATGANFQQGLQAGQFGNQAQQQDYSQQLGNSQFANQAMLDQYQQQLAGGQFVNQAAGQQFSQNLSQADLQNQARLQATNEASAQGQFANQAQNQNFAQNLSAAGLQNQAQQQGFSQQQSQADLYNQAIGQQFSQNTAAGQFANQAQAQQFAQGQQNAALSDQARQQGLQEQLALRQLPLNEYNALRSSSQVQMPQFQGVNGAQVANTNVAGNIQNAYQAQLNAYNQQIASQNSMSSNLFGLGGTIGSALIASSDERLKRDIEKIGETPAGLGVYEFKYIWDDEKHTGVMAHEVEALIPEAVVIDASGFKSVNYGMVR